MADKLLEVADGVVGVAHEESLGLLAPVLLAVDVGKDGGDLTICEYDRKYVRTLAVEAHLYSLQSQTGWRKHLLTSVLVRDDLSLVVNSVGDRAVGVAESQANDRAVARRRARPRSASLSHLKEGGGEGVELIDDGIPGRLVNFLVFLGAQREGGSIEVSRRDRVWLVRDVR